MGSLPVARVAVSALVLVVIGTLVIAKGRSHPAVAVGWWWYVGTLLPVAGLIQVGSQSYADRYAYVPLVGVFIVVVWSVLHAIEGRPASWGRGVAVAGMVWIAALALATRAQLPHWHDSVSLFQRAIDVVPGNGLAHNNLGMALVERNDLPTALEHFRKAVEFAPWDTDARSNMGNALRALGRPSEAIEAYEGALERSPEDASIHYNLATAFVDVGNADGAVTHLREALRLNPEHAKARALLQRLERSAP
jgi:Tfp pilus assembly protein PilF